ncbi:tetratricopeptide repeat protein [Leeuwenhoekiella parthenopeia]|uniref:Tetratricopeptide repeat protein n=1 Tax=Leeuwenhoekiella parthenopeia TaxID=2890320 RepID=A0ABS8GVJ6_9FLAO|nr:tetratricopeptide repeat protein [Leeuwenhoekiella parthenopeia]MCC4213508.1 tetratricopeptide repeat protein [Leeuwenhoekiella parthenopeia]
MKTKFKLLFVALIGAVSFASAQATEECVTTMSIFSEHAKVKNYDAAYEPFMKLRKDCPTTSFALYQYGERILKDKIEKSSGAEQKAFLTDLQKMYQEKKTHFASKTNEGEDISELALVMYENKIGTTEEQYEMFKKAWETDKASFRNAKGLYVFFNHAVSLQEAGKIELQEVFDLYDGVQGHITEIQNNYATDMEKILEKNEAGTALTPQEKQLEKAAEVNLSNYSKVSAGVNGMLGKLADCDRLIPFYQADFEAKKNDVAWVRGAAGRLVSKECTDSELFVSLVEQLNTLEPSAQTSYYLGRLAEQRGENAKALEYYEESAERQTDPAEKAKVYYRLGENFRDKGNYPRARTYYQKAVASQPSMGIVYLRIASMYVSSANNCGNTRFEKLAVYWLAAETAAKAGRIDPSLADTANKTAASYRASAPTREMIFSEGNAGQRINFTCWIGGGVTVPSL